MISQCRMVSFFFSSASLFANLLHLLQVRCDQPVSDDEGNALCWNGEIYGMYVCMYVCMYVYVCTYVCFWGVVVRGVGVGGGCGCGYMGVYISSMYMYNNDVGKKFLE